MNGNIYYKIGKPLIEGLGPLLVKSITIQKNNYITYIIFTLSRTAYLDIYYHTLIRYT